MAVISVFPIVSLTQWVRRYRAARAENRTRRLIEALPRQMQKDIGWPDPVRHPTASPSRETWRS